MVDNQHNFMSKSDILKHLLSLICKVRFMHACLPWLFTHKHGCKLILISTLSSQFKITFLSKSVAVFTIVDFIRVIQDVYRMYVTRDFKIG